MSRLKITDNVKMALVTGASSGIGYAYAKQLAAMGINLLLVSNEAEKLQLVSDELNALYGITAIPHYADLSLQSAALDLFSFCCEKGYGIDVLINNAGIFSFKDIVESDAGRLETMLNLHVFTPSMLCRYFGNEMKKRRRGYILNMSSLSAWLPAPGIAMYSATKAYLKVFSFSFSLEMKPFNVSVTTVTPGAVATDLYHLKQEYQSLGIRLGVILPPEKLVKKALRGLFCRKKLVLPGVINRLFIFFYNLLPDTLIVYIKKKISKYES